MARISSRVLFRLLENSPRTARSTSQRESRCKLASHPKDPLNHSVVYSFEVDPRAVLEIDDSATLQEIRDAYRRKARKYHPDHGGDEWVFRIVAEAYGILSKTRVMGRVAQETTQPEPPPHPASSSTSPTPPPFARETAEGQEWMHPGRRDPWIEPPRLIDVEILTLRFAITDPTDLLRFSAAERTLSCSLTIKWNAPSADPSGATHPDAPLVLQLLLEVFNQLPERIKADSTSWTHSTDLSFEAWLSYPTATRAQEAFRLLHNELNNRGLGVNQWTRELILPRN